MTKVNVVWGPPAAGKSTYVNDRKGENDLIFDFDLLMRDLSGLDLYDRNENLISYLVDFRQQIIDTLETEKQLDTAWMIVSYPEGELKEQLEKLGAEFTLVFESEETCRERIENDDQRKDKEEWKRVVTEWFEKYEQLETKAEVVKEMPRKKKGNKFWEIRASGDTVGEVFIYGEISEHAFWDDEIAPKEFKQELDDLGDVDILNIYINSPGGDVFAGQAIYSILKRHNSKKRVYVDGLAASIASLIAMAGDEIIMPENAMMMIHSPWTLAIGNAQEFRKIADDMDKIRESMIAVYESRSSLTREEITDMLDAETWMSAEDCVEYGFADTIEEAQKAAACADPQILARYQNTPKHLLPGGEFDLSRSEARFDETENYVKKAPEATETESGKPDENEKLKKKIAMELEL